MTPTARAGAHRRDVEGLRAVAVLLVVLYHCGVPFLPGGYVGVDVFFVLSGFLITGLLIRPGVSLVDFYARRVRRLLPAALLVVAVTVGWAWAVLPPLRVPGVARDGVFASLYALNYRLAASGVDYLNAGAPPSPLRHFWSLAVEEQFYLVWPVLLLTAYRWRRGLVGLIVVVSLGLSVWQTAASPTWAYFGLPARAWELGVGALVAIAGGRLPRVCAIAGLGTIVGAAVVFDERTAFPGWAAAVPVAGTVVVLLARSRLLDAGPWQVVGRLSYSWYLWHWPFLMLGPGHRLVLAALALGAAAVTYALVENPIRRGCFPARASVAAGLAVTLAVACGCWVVTPRPERTGFIASAPDGLSMPPVVPDNLTPSLGRAKFDQPVLYRDRCNSGFTDASVRRPCVYGTTGSRATVVLFGDSHAGAWFPAVSAVASRRGWRLVVVTKSACSVASVLIFQDKLRRPFTECVRWRESAFDYIASLRPVMVLMASAAAGGDLAIPAPDPDAVWTSGWTRSVRRLARTGARLHYLEDTPYQAADVPECLSARTPAACTVPRSAAFPAPARRSAVAAAMRSHGVTLIDPVPWFCTASNCPVIVGNVLVYRDASHITATYARLLAPRLDPLLAP